MMRYPEHLITPMREELTQLGVKEARTPQELDTAVKSHDTVMVVVNSVCGCAAGRARPAVAMALQHGVKPAESVTVFAGADLEATDRVRSHYFAEYPPSSPSIGILKGGKPVYLMPRNRIEGREAPEIAADLKQAFEQFCR